MRERSIDGGAVDAVIITIDGPAGTGKTTVGHQLARRLGVEFLDTGAMYRAVALLTLESGVSVDDGPAIARMIPAAHMHFDWSSEPPRLLLGDRDVSRRIRDRDVSEIVSEVARHPEVRSLMVDAQRIIAARHPRLVSEGRDQGSVVFPDAVIRFYLDAAAEVRAERRVDQLRRDGREVDRDAVIAEIQHRDHVDAGRRVAPLRKPQGGIVVDTGPLTLDQVVDRLDEIARSILPASALRSAGAGG